MIVIGRCLGLLFMIFLSGCAAIPGSHYFQNSDQTYRRAQSIPPLRIPPGISSEQIEARYPVSYKYYPESSTAVSLVPPGLYQ